MAYGSESWHCRLALVSWGHDTYERELKAGGAISHQGPYTYSLRHTSLILYPLSPKPFVAQINSGFVSSSGEFRGKILVATPDVSLSEKG